MNKSRMAHLQKLIPRNSKGEQLEFNKNDFIMLEESLRIAKKRTSMIALELVLDLSLRDALCAAYMQGMNDKVITEK
jgi:hypothetical protein